MRFATTIAAAAALAATPALAQELTEEQILERDPAAEIMIREGTVGVEPAWVRPSEVIATLRERGYTGITEFDVEWNEYEVEAVSPTGEEVEIEIDPYTGRITDIDRDWF